MLREDQEKLSVPSFYLYSGLKCVSSFFVLFFKNFINKLSAVYQKLLFYSKMLVLMCLRNLCQRNLRKLIVV